MDDDGWIAREQILGAEARSKVPQEFQVQYPHYANPPTLYLVLESLIDKIKAGEGKTVDPTDPFDSIRSASLRDPSQGINYLKELYPLLKRQYFWFRKTQSGEIKSYDREAFSTKEAYRWRGRTADHILTSGLDDYPRPQPPHPSELHVDLLSWVGMMTRSIKRIAETIGETDDVAEFRGYETAILRNLDDLHWSKKHETYCDATIDDYEESIHVCHKGYVSIFPFLVGLLPPDSPRLQAILQTISDPEDLWSEFGIRSLSTKDEFYGSGENYWRSPIWMNMNYMALKQLYVSIPPSPPCGSFDTVTNHTPALRLLPEHRDRTARRRARCTTACAGIWRKTSTTSGPRRASRGNSTTPPRARGSARSISPGGRAWWSRL
jgi:mannosyl-oligosaccharide glucosidase